MKGGKKFSIVLNNDVNQLIENISEKTNVSKAEVIRGLINKGLREDMNKDYENLVADVVRKQMEIVIKPHIERLAKISAKSGHMAGRSAFLNAQIARDLVPAERRRDVNELWNNAQKKAVAYMKLKVNEYGEPLALEELESEFEEQ